MTVRTGTRYSAMDIAKYVVDRRYKCGKPISNLQLQKILYFLQLIFARETRTLLFPEEFEAWPYGPVIRAVYIEFSGCGGYPIRREFSVDIDKRLCLFLDAGVDLLAEKSPWDLVRISHADKSPWDIVYNEHGAHKGLIPNEMIMDCALKVGR